MQGQIKEVKKILEKSKQIKDEVKVDLYDADVSIDELIKKLTSIDGLFTKIY